MEPENPGLELMKAAGEGFGRESSNKIFNAVSGLFPFWGLKKKAVDAYIAEIQQSDLSPEIKMMAIANSKKTFKELQNQAAIAARAYDAAKNGTDFSEASRVDDEWLSRFMDAGKHVSNETVQELWGNILAGEFESPGSTPPGIIRVMSELTPKYAKAFSNLCSLKVMLIPSDKNRNISAINEVVIVPNEQDAPYLLDIDLDFHMLSEMDTLGLISFNASAEYVYRFEVSKHPYVYVYYNNESFLVEQYKDRGFPIGRVMLTDIGQTISGFVQKKEIAGHIQAVENYLLGKHSVKIDKNYKIVIEEVESETGTVYSYRTLHKEPQQKQEPQQISEI